MHTENPSNVTCTCSFETKVMTVALEVLPHVSVTDDAFYVDKDKFVCLHRERKTNRSVILKNRISFLKPIGVNVLAVVALHFSPPLKMRNKEINH